MINARMVDLKRTILVVEDESLLLRAITKKLEVSGFTPVGFSSGQEAIKYLESAQNLPAAIWLDYYLKDTNGLTFMHEIQRFESLKKIPVMVVSNSASPDSVHNMLVLGVKKYILKSDHKLEEIITIMKDIVDNGME